MLAWFIRKLENNKMKIYTALHSIEAVKCGALLVFEWNDQKNFKSFSSIYHPSF